MLIVEDEAPLVMMLRYNLEREGFAVDAAADGEEALLRIAVQRRDAVLHIRRLRKALNAGGAQDVLRTARSVGYALNSDG